MPAQGNAVSADLYEMRKPCKGDTGHPINVFRPYRALGSFDWTTEG
jgi:hypothetical protein